MKMMIHNNMVIMTNDIVMMMMTMTMTMTMVMVMINDHEPSLIALAITSLLLLSGRAAKLVLGSNPYRSTWISFFQVCLCCH